jgi:hypothetical protein
LGYVFLTGLFLSEGDSRGFLGFWGVMDKTRNAFMLSLQGDSPGSKLDAPLLLSLLQISDPFCCLEYFFYN